MRKSLPLRRKPPSQALPAPDLWHAFCDAMDQVHRGQAECRTELLSMEQDVSHLVAAALAPGDQHAAAAAQAAMPPVANGARRKL